MEGVRLHFFAPLTGIRRHAWEAGDVESVRVVPTESLDGAIELARSTTLAEIQIHLRAGPVVHLFTDHQAYQLVAIGEAVRTAIALPTKLQGDRM